MPRFDGSGPQGRGPRSGRGIGCCGRRRQFFSPKNELAFLEEEEKVLEEELAIIREEKMALKDQLN